MSLLERIDALDLERARLLDLAADQRKALEVTLDEVERVRRERDELLARLGESN